MRLSRLFSKHYTFAEKQMSVISSDSLRRRRAENRAAIVCYCLSVETELFVILIPLQPENIISHVLYFCKKCLCHVDEKY